MSLTAEQVRHIALLARLGLSDEDVPRFASQLSVILDYFEELRAVDTEDVPPTAHTLDLHNLMRDDEPVPPPETKEVLSNAPVRERDFFRVRAILDE